MTNDTSGPFIRWVNYGYEGWQPQSFPDLATMLTTPCSDDFEITKKIDFKIAEDGSVSASWR